MQSAVLGTGEEMVQPRVHRLEGVRSVLPRVGGLRSGTGVHSTGDSLKTLRLVRDPSHSLTQRQRISQRDGRERVMRTRENAEQEETEPGNEET